TLLFLPKRPNILPVTRFLTLRCSWYSLLSQCGWCCAQVSPPPKHLTFIPVAVPSLAVRTVSLFLVTTFLQHPSWVLSVQLLLTATTASCTRSASSSPGWLR